MKSDKKKKKLKGIRCRVFYMTSPCYYPTSMKRRCKLLLYRTNLVRVEAFSYVNNLIYMAAGHVNQNVS